MLEFKYTNLNFKKYNLTLNSPSLSSISKAYPDTLDVGWGDHVAVTLLFSPTHSSARNSGTPGAKNENIKLTQEFFLQKLLGCINSNVYIFI